MNTPSVITIEVVHEVIATRPHTFWSLPFHLVEPHRPPTKPWHHGAYPTRRAALQARTRLRDTGIDVDIVDIRDWVMATATSAIIIDRYMNEREGDPTLEDGKAMVATICSCLEQYW